MSSESHAHPLLILPIPVIVKHYYTMRCSTLKYWNIHDSECLFIHSSSCTLTATPFEKSLTDCSLPTSHSSAPTFDCGAVETQHRIPSLPPPPQEVRCPPLWATAAQTALLLCSALGRWPPGETRPDLTIPPNCMGEQRLLHGRLLLFLANCSTSDFCFLSPLWGILFSTVFVSESVILEIIVLLLNKKHV